MFALLEIDPGEGSTKYLGSSDNIIKLLEEAKLFAERGVSVENGAEDQNDPDGIFYSIKPVSTVGYEVIGTYRESGECCAPLVRYVVRCQEESSYCRRIGDRPSN